MVNFRHQQAFFCLKLKLGHFSLPVTWEKVFSGRRFKIVMHNKIYNACIYARLSRDDGDKLESLHPLRRLG